MGRCLVADQTLPNSAFVVKTCIESFCFSFSLLQKNETKEVYSGFTCWSKYS